MFRELGSEPGFGPGALVHVSHLLLIQEPSGQVSPLLTAKEPVWTLPRPLGWEVLGHRSSMSLPPACRLSPFA